MEIEFAGDRIHFNRPLSDLDQFVLTFCKILEKAGLTYVIISGYLPIVFGRPRGTEDVDVFIRGNTEKLPKLLKEAGFWAVNCDLKDATKELQHNPVRFAEEGKVFPNMEVKFETDTWSTYALDNKKELLLNKETLFISPLELQIAYKLSLGSEKDIEDARFLFAELEEHLTNEDIKRFATKLQVEEKLVYLGEAFEK